MPGLISLSIIQCFLNCAGVFIKNYCGAIIRLLRREKSSNKKSFRQKFNHSSIRRGLTLHIIAQAVKTPPGRKSFQVVLLYCFNLRLCCRACRLYCCFSLLSLVGEVEKPLPLFRPQRFARFECLQWQATKSQKS